MLHEQGHIVGLDHFGAGNKSYIMRPKFSAGKADVTRVIDADAIHGVRDLYAIPVPEPSSIVLFGLGTVIGMVFIRPRLKKRC